jgi:hypothetical protein
MIGPPIGVDDEIGGDVRSRRLDEDVHSLRGPGAAFGVADDPPNGIAGGNGAAILSFARDKAFGPSDIEIMDAAFQLVCRLLRLSSRDEDARSTAAVIIIELMARGERIPSRLAYAAIRELDSGPAGQH